MLYRRSATYMNNLVKIASMEGLIANRIQSEKNNFELEERRKLDLETVYKYIEERAKRGAVRVFDVERSTPVHIRKLLFEDEEIRGYLTKSGFMYTYDSIEWYGVEAHDERLS
jgi:hypothetical protein